MIAADGSGRRRPGSWRRESVTRRGFMMIGGRGERVNLNFYFFDFDFQKYFAECSASIIFLGFLLSTNKGEKNNNDERL